MDTFAKEVEALKAREDAVILAHYYTDGAVQSVADDVGDSFYLAKVAAKTGRSTRCPRVRSASGFDRLSTRSQRENRD